ncbi:MAG: isocitrate/isopropylmalate dehydrogenase family protein [Myxococcota bacterium]|nr:isocitrate/isopropylmalate dehydrogenase family protein [Myxococcota bacterium]MDW8362619.1 isocitrate/isopropylmalate dehydrogenase family protein [Myxococcales bacterium]
MARNGKKTVAVIAGDGIGPEVVRVGVGVLERLIELRGYPIEIVPLDVGAERYLRDGTSWPPAIARFVREQCDAVLLGALGDPRVPDLGYARDILFGLRQGLDLYCNIRPVVCLHDRLMPLRGRRAADCNFVVFRENTEGIYAGIGGTLRRDGIDEIAINEDVNTRRGVERIVRAAFDWARRHGKRRVHMADKSNAMPHAHGLWHRCFFEVAADYPDIEARHLYIDALCYELVRDPSPFEVIVTCNLFGDIVTDLGAALQGGLGMAASANVHPGRVSMFEPVHGSAPPLAGRDLANPFATVLSVGMMLSHLGWPEEEVRLVELVRNAIEAGRCTPDVGGSLGTRAAGEALIAAL